jgi:hypothetical protein
MNTQIPTMQTQVPMISTQIPTMSPQVPMMSTQMPTFTPTQPSTSLSGPTVQSTQMPTQTPIISTQMASTLLPDIEISNQLPIPISLKMAPTLGEVHESRRPYSLDSSFGIPGAYNLMYGFNIHPMLYTSSAVGSTFSDTKRIGQKDALKEIEEEPTFKKNENLSLFMTEPKECPIGYEMEYGKCVKKFDVDQAPCLAGWLQDGELCYKPV